MILAKLQAYQAASLGTHTYLPDGGGGNTTWPDAFFHIMLPVLCLSPPGVSLPSRKTHFPANLLETLSK